MIPPVPRVEDYDISEQYGFLPSVPPLELLPDRYYGPWEAIAANFQPLLLSKRLREVVRNLPVLSTSRLQGREEWRRAYTLLVFMTHGYIWGGNMPEERIPASISIPLLEVCEYLELPPVATYAGVCLWNFKPIFPNEPFDSLENLATLTTFTGSLDESWFYLVSAAIEARGGPMIPVLLNAIGAARRNESHAVTAALQTLAERLDELGSILTRMYENCDPHVFYHRIRPYLAGSRNMTEAGLPNGVIYEDGSGTETYRQYGGGSNAQSSLLQFFDIILGIEHRPTGVSPPGTSSSSSDESQPSPPPPSHNFIMEMRAYMPGPHARFLTDVTTVANIREFVTSRPRDRALSMAYDASLAMLRTLRDKHIQMVSRYIIIKSRESRSHSRSLSPPVSASLKPKALNLAIGTSTGSGKMRGTGGTALIPFLKQARDETGEPAIDAWARRLLGDRPVSNSPWNSARKGVALGIVGEHYDGNREIVGLAGTWVADESEGGLCHW